MFHKYYANELPDARLLAENTAAVYFESFHDVTDASDKKAVTDALLSCYVYCSGDRYAVYRNPTEYENYASDMTGSFYGIGVVIKHDKTKNTINNVNN